MHPIHFHPPVTLAPYIASYGIWDVDEGLSESFVLPPLGFCGFIICLDRGIKTQLNGNLFIKGMYSAVGQRTAPLAGEIVGRNKIVMAFLHPFGMYQLFGIDMSLLTNATLPLVELVGEEKCLELTEKLNKAASHKKIVGVMNEFFLEQLPAFEISKIATNALRYIHQQRGNVSVKEIQTNCYITARSLERHFKLYIGLGPKEYVMIYRFKHLVSFINQNPGVTWAALCEQNGYYDQSHLTRYFSRYFKVKPGEVVNLDKDIVKYLLQ